MGTKSFLTALITRVLLTVFGGLLVKAGFSEEEILANAEQIANALSGIIVILGVMFWAWIEKKKLLKTAAKDDWQPTQKTLSVLMLAGLTVLTVGCNMTPRQRVMAAEKLFTQQVGEFTRNVEEGHIRDPQVLVAAKFAIIEVNKLLDAAHEAALAGQDEFQLVWPKLEEALDRWLTIYIKANSNSMPEETSCRPQKSQSCFAQFWAPLPYSLASCAT